MKKTVIIIVTIIIAVLAILFLLSPPQPKFVNGEYRMFSSEKGRLVIMDYYNELMSLWEVPYIEKDLETSFGKTHVVITGKANGRPLVLLHGAGSNSAAWAFCIKEVSRSNRVYAIDTIGDIGKSRPVKLAKSEVEYARWLDEVFTKLEIKQATVMGASYGGFLTHCLMHYYPEKVDKAILIAYSYMSEPVDFSAISRMIYYSMLPSRNNIEKEVCWLNGGNKSGIAMSDKFVKLIYSSAVFGRTSLINPTNIEESVVRNIKVPVLIIIGDRDPIYKVEKAKDYCKRVNPLIRMEVINGEGHLFAVNQPDRVNAMILDFLK